MYTVATHICSRAPKASSKLREQHPKTTVVRSLTPPNVIRSLRDRMDHGAIRRPLVADAETEHPRVIQAQVVLGIVAVDDLAITDVSKFEEPRALAGTN